MRLHDQESPDTIARGLTEEPVAHELQGHTEKEEPVLVGGGKLFELEVLDYIDAVPGKQNQVPGKFHPQVRILRPHYVPCRHVVRPHCHYPFFGEPVGCARRDAGKTGMPSSRGCSRSKMRVAPSNSGNVARAVGASSLPFTASTPTAVPPVRSSWGPLCGGSTSS